MQNLGVICVTSKQFSIHEGPIRFKPVNILMGHSLLLTVETIKPDILMK